MTHCKGHNVISIESLQTCITESKHEKTPHNPIFYKPSENFKVRSPLAHPNLLFSISLSNLLDSQDLECAHNDPILKVKGTKKAFFSSSNNNN